jgi:hypothetical protein
MNLKSNHLLMIMGVTSFVLPFIFNSFFTRTNSLGQNFIDLIIHDGFNHLLRALLVFILFEPLSLLWKKFIRKKTLHPMFSKDFWDDEIESLFVYWIFLILLFLPGYPMWYLFR